MARRVRLFIPKLAGQPWNDAGSPPFLLLPRVDQSPNVPIQTNQFGVYGSILQKWHGSGRNGKRTPGCTGNVEQSPALPLVQSVAAFGDAGKD